MSTLRNQYFSAILGLLLVVWLLPPTVSAQSRTEAIEPVEMNQFLQIGPVEGLTSAWHRAPTQVAVPLAATVQLRVPNSRSLLVDWTGAHEVQRLGSRSTAEVRFHREGTHEVAVRYRSQLGEWVEESIEIEVIDTVRHPIRISAIRASAPPLVLDEDNPNASSMGYFFQRSSIAAVREVEPGYFRTSVERWIDLEVNVEPAAFAPLIEWRLDGQPQQHLGSQIRMQLFGTGLKTIAAGPEAGPSKVDLETYRVRLVESEDVRFVDGVPVTLRAVTEPPGYEDEVTWLASTKFGGCSPPLGEGAEFETVFFGTTGTDGRWVGIKADHATVASDQKGAVSNLWVGTFTTEAVNVRLELSLTFEQGLVMGTWGFVGADDIDLGGGTLMGTLTGSEIVLDLGDGLILEGTLSADESSMGGDVVSDGAVVGAWLSDRCSGPDVRVVRGRADARPPFSFCRIRDDGIFVEFENRGQTKSGPADFVAVLVRDGGVIDSRLGIVPMLEPGETSSGIISFTEIENLDEFAIEIESQAGECSIRNNVASSVCITDLASP